MNNWDRISRCVRSGSTFTLGTHTYPHEALCTIVSLLNQNDGKNLDHGKPSEEIKQCGSKSGISALLFSIYAETQAAYEKARKQEKASTSRGSCGIRGGFSGGMPGGDGMPGAGGMPGGQPGTGGMPSGFDNSRIFSAIYNDPEMMAAVENPEIIAALQDGRGMRRHMRDNRPVLTGIHGNPLGGLARQLGLPLHKHKIDF